MTNKITIFSIAAALATFTAAAQGGGGAGGAGGAGGSAGTGSSGTGVGSGTGTGVGNAGVGNSGTAGNSGNATGGALPPGLQNRNTMPPGLQNGQLPPGLASRTNGMGSGLDTNSLGITSEQGLFPNQAQVNTRSNQWGGGTTNGLFPTSRTNSQRGIYALTNRFGMNTNLPPTGLTNGAGRFGMPPGLDNREQLPPGLDRREQLPPGLEGRTNSSGSGL